MYPLDLLSRWIHVAGAAFILGGFLYMRFIAGPASGVLDPAQRQALWAAAAERYRPWAIGVLVAVLASGLYNFMRVMEGGVVGMYHMIFGIKFLLGLHVFAMLIVLSKPPSGAAGSAAKRQRLAFGAVLSALVIFALAAYMRTLHA